MIQLIEAPPRSGKTFFAVNYLMRFCEYDALYFEYVLRPEVLVISNIEGLKIKHWTLKHCLKDKTLEEFFSIANFEAIQAKTGKNHIILMIDEAHELFPAGFKSPSVYEFFAFHGHIGLDVFLMTQGIDAMSRLFNPLLEVVIKCVPRSKKVTKNFTYKYYDLQGRFLYAKLVPTKQLVFAAYKSFRQDEFNKPRSAVVIWICVVAVLFILGGGGIVWAINHAKNLGKKPGDESAQVADVEKPAVTRSSPVQKILADHQKKEAEKEAAWVSVSVDGWVERSGKRWYLINGRSYPDSAKFRKFDPYNRLVEVFGGVAPPSDSRVVAQGAQRRGPQGATATEEAYGFAGSVAVPGLEKSDPNVIAMPPNRQTANPVHPAREIREYNND